jgi:hypothetical protein
MHIRLPKELKLHIALSVGGLWKGRGEEGSGLWFEVLQQCYPTKLVLSMFWAFALSHTLDLKYFTSLALNSCWMVLNS